MVYWDRITLKTRAKTVLRNSYWMTLLTLFVGYILGADADNSGIVYLLSVSWLTIISPLVTLFRTDSVSSIMFGSVFFIGILVLFFSIGYIFFIGSPIAVGKCRFLIGCRYDKKDISELFFAFRKENYSNIVKTMILKNLYICLWSLLFIIPGIIKSYEYIMVPYILAENPRISKDRVFEISKNTTCGEKWNMFVLDLSFIGWRLLGMLACCGIGVFFLNPYVQATQAELYGALRYKAVANRICIPDEIGRELFG